jgi:hypothetical protein
VGKGAQARRVRVVPSTVSTAVSPRSMMVGTARDIVGNN